MQLVFLKMKKIVIIVMLFFLMLSNGFVYRNINYNNNPSNLKLFHQLFISENRFSNLYDYNEETKNSKILINIDNQNEFLLENNKFIKKEKYINRDENLNINAKNNIYENSTEILDNIRKQNNEDREFLIENLAIEACNFDRGSQRKDRLNEIYLNYCNRYKLENIISDKILMSIMHNSNEECEKILNDYIKLDKLIQHFDSLFIKLLSRYNCDNGYSVKWKCDDCKIAYKDWLCATNLQYYMNGEQVKPCISFCERVEQRCPYLHPIQKEQYGGQPVFICKDSNIPYVLEITPDIPYNEPSKCYDLCHLSENFTELAIDSLSKYYIDECPDKNSIAEEVRKDLLLFSNAEGEQKLQNKQNESKNFENKNANDDELLRKKNDNLEIDFMSKKLKELSDIIVKYKSQSKIHSH